MLVFVSGPSGVGKTSIVQRVLKNRDDILRIVTTTTRKPRYDEIDGKDYNFVSKKQFNNWVKEDEMLEYAKVHGNYYGMPYESFDKQIKKAKKEEKIVLYVPDVKGFETLRKKLADHEFSSIFIKAPSLDELENRLDSRGTEDVYQLQTRLENATKELDYQHNYDYVIVNDKLESACKEFEQILGQIKKDLVGE